MENDLFILISIFISFIITFNFIFNFNFAYINWITNSISIIDINIGISLFRLFNRWLFVHLFTCKSVHCIFLSIRFSHLSIFFNIIILAWLNWASTLQSTFKCMIHKILVFILELSIITVNKIKLWIL